MSTYIFSFKYDSSVFTIYVYTCIYKYVERDMCIHKFTQIQLHYRTQI